MSITELKDEIYKALESTSDKQVLKIINELLQSRQEEIVGYSGDAPITKSDLYKRAIEAEQDWKDGKIFTVDEVREKFRVRRNDG